MLPFVNQTFGYGEKIKIITFGKKLSQFTEKMSAVVHNKRVITFNINVAK